MKKFQTEMLLLLLLPFVTGLFFSCGDDTGLEPAASVYNIPEQTGDGWQTASLDAVGISEVIISEAIDRINYKLYQNVHSILIVKDGKLVFEEYFDGYKWNYSGSQFRGDFTEFGINTNHNMASVTKSFTSALVGIAIDQGLIESVDQKVFTFFPEHSGLINAQKDRIALKHLLSMSAGLEWDEWSYPYTDSRNSHVAMNRSGDPIRYVLARPVVAEPGRTFVYNSGLSITLGEIIFKTSGLRADKYAEESLFGPLGITDYVWEKYGNGTVQTGGGLYLRPRDTAKFGCLFLQNGAWNGQQILSKEWIEESTKTHISVDSVWRYGHQWWLRTYHLNSRSLESFAARGWGGQNIIVFPILNMVVVFTGGNYATPEPNDEILNRFILPAAL